MTEAKAESKTDSKKKSGGSEEKKVGKFTHGDHMVHFLIQKGKKFIPASPDDRTVNIIIEVCVGDIKQYTTAKSDVVTNDESLVAWDEHVFFEMKNLSPQKAKETMINIRLLNQGWVKNEIIGQAIFDLSSIYFNDDHKIEHQWVGLDNPDAEDFENMKGLLKISANVTGPNDNAQKLEPHVGPEPEKMKMFMSPSIKRTFYQLVISIIEAQNMPEFGGILTADSLEAYFKASYGGGNAIKTKVVNQVNKKVSVNQKFLLPVQTPVLQDRLVISAWDYNKVQSDQIIGSLILSVKRLVTEGSKEGGFFIWKELYGSPKDNSGDEADAMDANPEIASDWKGSILMHISAIENDKPKKGVEDLSDEKKPQKNSDDEDQSAREVEQVGIKTRAKQEGWMHKEDYEVMIEVGQGITMPEKDKKYRVQVSIQNNDWKSDLPKEIKGEYLRWHSRCNKKKEVKKDTFEPQRYKFPKNLNSLFTTPKEQLSYQEELRVYIYLIDEEDKTIAFWYGPLSDFKELDSKWRWIQLKPDKTFGVIDEDYKAGMVSVKIGVARLEQHGGGSIPWKNHMAWKVNPPKRIGAFTLRAFIFQCRDLPAADSDGSSDPFIKLFNTGEDEIETQVIEDNINPIFMECKDIGLDYLQTDDDEDYSSAPPIILDILDADEGFISTTADFLGRCKIFLSQIEDLVVGTDRIPIPKWYDIKYGTDDDSPACGQVLVSFSMRAPDAIDVTEIEFCPGRMHEMVEKKDYNIFINCLGLRELESMGLIPIQKPFVSFMVKSLTDPRKSGTIANIKTLPGPTGCNPNINSVIKFNIPLPCDRLYCPSLSCTVYDQVFLGFSQPQIGSFTLPLGQIKDDNEQENQDWLADGEWLIERLRMRCEEQDNPQLIEVADNADGHNTAENLHSEVVVQTEVGEPEDELLASLDKEEEKKDILKVKPKAKIPQKKVSAESKREIQRQKTETRNEEKEKRKQHAREAFQTMDSSNNVLIPTYKYDDQLRVYREVFQPDPKIFKPVGFNTQPKIKEIMELMKKIPPSAAISDELKLQNPSLAKKLKNDMLKRMTTIRKNQGNEKEKEALEDVIPEEQKKDELQIASEILNDVYLKTGKHYRVFFEDELENDKEVFPKSIFYNANIMRGQTRGVQKSFFSFGGGNQDESGQESTLRSVGKFKGVIDIFNEEEKKEFDEKKVQMLDEIFNLLSRLHEKRTGEAMSFSLESVQSSTDKANFISECRRMKLVCIPKLVKFLEHESFQGQIKDLLSRQSGAIVHLYMIQGFEFASRDLGSPSDPYLYIYCGETEFNEQENYQEDTPSPKFNKRYDINVSFPGAPPLVIEAYDYDMLFGDDLIGKTTIDLDDRFFNPRWAAIEEKPIETRELYHSSSIMNQGMIDLWVDIDPATKTSDCGKVWELETEPTRQFEVRVSIYKCTGVPMEDWEGTSDVFIKAFIADEDKQETDTHYRCTTGIPSFNYRLLFGVQTPTIKPFMLTLQAWDRDLLKSNDLICQWQLDITQIVRDSKITANVIHVQREYYEKTLKDRTLKVGDPDPFEFPKNKNDGDVDQTIVLTSYSPADPEKKKPIKIYMDLRVVPGDYAEANKVGAARSDPNVEPNLPPPVGRFQLSLNPFKMLNQMCGASLRRKIWCCCCCIICLVVLYYVMPLLASFKTLFS